MDENFAVCKAKNATYYKYDNPKEKISKVHEIFYLNGDKYMKGTYDNGVKNGPFIYYYQGGLIKEIKNFTEGRVVGAYEAWYPNGKKKEEGDFKDSNYRLLYFWDSLGMPLIIQGNGLLVRYFSNGKVKEEGRYGNAFKIGEWKGYTPKGKLFYEEEYDSYGKLLKGKSFYKRKTYVYTQILETAHPQGGVESFLNSIGQHMKYPEEAKVNRIQGEVFVRFMVEKSGKLTNVEIMKGLGYGCDEAVLEAFKKVPKWSPSKKRGQPVRQSLVLPIRFEL